MQRRILGQSGIAVSAMALGSWQTYERLPAGTAAAILRQGFDLGVTFLDDARYDDPTGAHESGYSEVVFGETFRAAGLPRDEIVLAEKLWYEFWPRQGAAAELDASLGRLKFDHVDLIYAVQPAGGVPVSDVVADVGGLITAGKARAWGTCMWPPELLAEALRECERTGTPPPSAVQDAHNLVHRSRFHDPAMTAVLERGGVSIVAASVLAGGVLSGKYGDPGAAGRDAHRLSHPAVASAVEVGEAVRALAAELDARPEQLAFAFALAEPRVAAVLFGATSPEQVRHNVGAVDLLSRLDDDALARLRAIGPTP
jgi:aryl-alcohol dehydrogenase-like predicted oxidoreductase